MITQTVAWLQHAVHSCCCGKSNRSNQPVSDRSALSTKSRIRSFLRRYWACNIKCRKHLNAKDYLIPYKTKTQSETLIMPACTDSCACVCTVERPVLLVQVARQRVSVPLGRLEHAFLFGGGELLAVLPEVAALSSLSAGDSCCEPFNVLHQLHVTAWRRQKRETQKEGEEINATETNRDKEKDGVFSIVVTPNTK